MREEDLTGKIAVVTGGSRGIGRHIAAALRRAGATVAILDAGAYSAVMSSTYNARPLAPIAMVDGADWAVIRDRQVFEDLWAGERMPAFLDHDRR